MPKCRRERPARARFDTVTDHVGTDALVRQAEQSSAEIPVTTGCSQVDAEVDRALARKAASAASPWRLIPERKRPLHGRKCASEIWRSCPMRTSAAEFHEESAAEYVGASVPLVRGLTTPLRTM